MTRILMFDNELPPLGGGMGTANLALLQRFCLSPEIEIDLVTSALGGKFEREQFSERIRIFKVPVWNRNIHHSTNRELIFYFVQALFLGLFLHLERRYQLSFAWSTLPAGASSRILHIFFRLPYQVWVSGPDIPGFEQRYRRLYPLLKPLIRDIWRHAAPVIAKCAEEVDLMKRTDRDISVQIIPNGVDLSAYLPADRETGRASLEVFCAARLIERKGQHHLIQAVRRLADEGIHIDVNLAGTGDSLETYRALASELGVQERIHFLGYIPREEIARYYQAADVFVLPSYNEGMSLAALEAMACGLPLVLSRTGGTADLVEEGANGFAFDWGDIESLVACLRLLAQDPNLCDRMGKASLEKSYQFSWETIKDSYLDLFSRYKYG